MKCPICAQELPSDAVFCGMCGKKIPRCPTCGEVLYERSRFCANDGTPLPEELFAAFPPADGAGSPPAPPPPPKLRQPPVEHPAPRPVAQPVQEPAGGPPAPPQKKKKKGGAIVVLVIVLLLALAAAGGGIYYIHQNGLPSFGGAADASSSEDTSRDGEEREDSDSKEIEKLLEKAEKYAEDGDYEKALNEIQRALEDHADSRKLKQAQEEYIGAVETDALARAAELAEDEGYPAAIQALQDALKVLGGESERLSAKAEEYQRLYDEELAAQTPQISAVSMDKVVSVTASSYLSEPNLNLYHTPERVTDGDLSTAWVEGLDGDGIGESITFEFDGVYSVSGLSINAGYQKSEQLYNQNGRPAVLTATFSDGTQQTLQLQDINGTQRITFSTPVETQRVTLSIGAVYSGTDYADTVISELSFY